ncbi:carbohydrate ABC transporter permease [Cohnella phaseoli]|uniref:Raffinose/stachyose/melibiose transport system permease protein n=1 Tax=Cohnella phaseoli TaxID=456490 RepID=A0A3D9JP06_9BACL|nr:sugar ABC transporter permease [Cohnella phaseoli]RED75738.1 raffinose/stachyose/melibiose transport system permease protein [Cohnella phaseoli]
MYVNKIYSKKFILPALILFFLLFLLPSFMGFYYSLTNWNSMSENIKFIGLDNFKEIFNDSGSFMFIKNTLMYAFFTTVLKVAIGLGLALMLNEGIKTKGLLRTIYFLPIIISNLIVGLMFQQVLHPSNGILNHALEFIGLSFLTQAWLEDPQWVMWSTIGVEVWKAAGFVMIIFLAGLQTVSKETIEASDMDGANYWNKLTKIIIPSIAPSILINTLLSVISGLKVFDVIFALTNGGPGRSSEVINITIFNQFSMGNYGYSTALGVLMFIFLAVISIGIIMIFTRKETNG